MIHENEDQCLQGNRVSTTIWPRISLRSLGRREDVSFVFLDTAVITQKYLTSSTWFLRSCCLAPLAPVDVSNSCVCQIVTQRFIRKLPRQLRSTCELMQDGRGVSSLSVNRVPHPDVC